MRKWAAVAVPRASGDDDDYSSTVVFVDDVRDGDGHPLLSPGSTTSNKDSKLKKFARRVKLPDVLVALVAVTAAVHWVGWKNVKCVGPIPSSLPPLTVPWTQTTPWLDCLLPATVICLVSTLLSSTTILYYAQGDTVRVQQDWLALGLAAIGGAFTCSFVPSGSLSRCAVVAACARDRPTQLVSVLGAAGVLVALLTLSPVIALIP